jgi:FKBP-type peptidyl-prolyl cis-trans isomerase FkpA
MKTKKYLQFSFIALLLVSILSSFEKCFFKKTATGLAYKVVRKGKGPKPQNGEFVLFTMLFKNEKGDTLFNPADQEPLVICYDDSNPENHGDGGLQEAFSMLKKGDKTLFKVNAKKLLRDDFERWAEKYHLEENTNLLVEIDVQDVLAQDAYKEWQEKRLQMRQEQQKEKAAKQLELDIESIDRYLSENKIIAQKTASGLRYVIDNPGKADAKAPQFGDVVKVNYIGKTLDGRLFDTSIEEVAKQHNVYNSMRTYGPLSFQVGKGQVIRGWEEGIKLLNKGAKARLFIPSPLAYGSYSMGEVLKANSILVFEIELVDIDNSKVTTE